MRVRSTVTGSYSTHHIRVNEKRTSCSNPWVVQTTANTYSGVVTTKTITDVQTPGFHSLVKCGGFLPLNPVVITTDKETRIAGSGDINWSYTSGCFRIRDTGSSVYGLLDHLCGPLPVDASIEAAVNQAAIAECKDAVFDLLTTLAELPQVAALFLSVARRLKQMLTLKAWQAREMAYRNRRSRRITRARWESLRPSRSWLDRLKLSTDPATVMSALWLEYRYAWLPLAYSLRDGIAAYNASIPPGQIISGRSPPMDQNIANSQTLTTGTVSSGTGQKVTVTAVLGTRRYRSVAYARVETSRLKQVRIDPLLTGWELIPFSFVVDWFLDVGTWIRAFSPFNGVTILGSCVSTKSVYTLESSFSQTVNSVSGTSGGVGSYSGAKLINEVETYDRGQAGGFSLPVWNPRLNLSRVLDGIALLYQGRREVNRILRL